MTYCPSCNAFESPKLDGRQAVDVNGQRRQITFALNGQHAGRHHAPVRHYQPLLVHDDARTAALLAAVARVGTQEGTRNVFIREMRWLCKTV